jgi:hypothetical protein
VPSAEPGPARLSLVFFDRLGGKPSWTMATVGLARSPITNWGDLSVPAIIDVWNTNTFDSDLLEILEPNARLVRAYFDTDEHIFLSYDLGSGFSGPATKSQILIFARSQPRSLLSIARSNRARSRMRLSRSKKKRTAQICLCVSGRFVPTVFPALSVEM